MSGTHDPDRARRVRRLTQLGMSVRAATRAVDRDRVTFALLDHLIGGPREFTREDAAGRTGVDPEVVRSIEAGAGVPESVRYSEADIHQLSLVARLLAMLPEEVVLEQIRADSPTMRSLALRTLHTVRHVLLEPALTDEQDPIDAALALAEVTRPLLDTTTDLVGQSFRRILLNLVTSDLVVEALRSPEETVEVAVAFVDVVGYTSLAARVDPEGLHDVLTTFETSCQMLAEAHAEVTLVKFLGDAAMFVALDPVALTAAIREIVERPAEDGEEDDDEDLPVSAGLAHGSALLRGGDYFGAAVNEAARLTDLARTHSLLVSEDLEEVLAPHFELRRIRPVKLHGIGRRRPYAVRERRE